MIETGGVFMTSEMTDVCFEVCAHLFVRKGITTSTESDNAVVRIHQGTSYARGDR